MFTSPPGGPACCASRRRPKRDRRQLGLRRRRLRPRGRRADRLLALPRPPREGAPRARIGRVGATSVCLRPPAVRAGLEVPATMNRRRKFIVGGVVIAGALAYMIYAGVTQSAVYFVTPAELRAAPGPGKAYRLGGEVGAGSATRAAHSRALSVRLSGGRATVTVR